MDINHFHLQVSDLKKSIEFYEKIFCFEVDFYNSDKAFLRNPDGFFLGLDRVDQPNPLPEWFHFGFGSRSEKELLTTYKKVQEIGLGTKILRDVQLSDDPINFYCADPSGNVMEIYFKRRNIHSAPFLKVPFPVDKRKWSPSLIPGGTVLISTLSENKDPHFAPKSWIQMVSFEPSILVFSGSKGQTTENNILCHREFVVNIVDEGIVDRAFSSIQWHGTERINKSELTFGPSIQVAVPVINECKAHLECRLLETMEIGSGFMIFGEIISASIWNEIEKEQIRSKRYQLLRQAVFQESGQFSVLDSIQLIENVSKTPLIPG